MADISQIQIGSTLYNLKDATARQALASIATDLSWNESTRTFSWTVDGEPYSFTIPEGTTVVQTVTNNQTSAVSSGAVYSFVTSGFVMQDSDMFTYAPQARVMPLVSMGTALDDGNTPATIANDEFYYDPNTKHIVRKGNTSQPWYLPQAKQLYINLCTGKLYKWSGTNMAEIRVPLVDNEKLILS